MKKITVILSILFFSLQIASAQKAVVVDMLKGSSLTIDGKTSLIPFKIKLNGDNFPTANYNVVANEEQNKIVLGKSTLLLMVNNFTSDNKMALRDFKKLVKADKYPEFTVKISSLELDKGENKKNSSTGNATGIITITGVTKQYCMPVTYAYENGSYSATGKIKLNIKDFNLTPPVTMMGLIRVSEWIDITLNLNFRLDNNSSQAIAKAGSN